MILDELVTELTYKINNNAEARKFIAALNHINNEGKKVNAALVKAFNSKPVQEFRRIIAKAQVNATKLKKAFHNLTNPIRRAVNWAKRLKDENQGAAVAAKKMEGAYGRIRGIIGTVLGTMGAMSFARMADEYAGSTASIKLAADSGNVQAVQEQIYKNSQATGTDYTSNVDLFASVARNKNELGLGDMDAVKLSDTVSKAIAITSKGAGADGAAILQFSQALGSGRLGGDELRSILENSGGLARAIADSFGVSVGKLKEMGAKGELTSDKLAKGLLEQSKNINEQFEKLPKTFGKGWQKIRNAMKKTAGNITENTRLAEGFYWITSKIADNFDDLAKFIGFGGLTGALMLFNSKIGSAKKGITNLIAAARPLLLPFAKAALMAYGLYLIGDDILVWLEGGDSLIGDWVGSFDEVKQKVTEFLKPLADILGDFDLGGDKLKKWGSIGLAVMAVFWVMSRPLRFIFRILRYIAGAFLPIKKNADGTTKPLKKGQRILRKIGKAIKWVAKLASGLLVRAFTMVLLPLLGLMLPFLPLLVIIGLLAGAAWWVYKNWDKVKAWFSEMCGKVGGWFSDLGDMMSNALSAAADAVMGAWKSVIGWLDSAITKVTDFLGITEEAKEASKAVKENIQENNQAIKKGKGTWSRDGGWTPDTKESKTGKLGAGVGMLQGTMTLAKKFANSELGQNIAASAKSYAKNGLPVTPVGTVPTHKTSNQTNTQHNNNTFNITTVEAMKTQEIANAASAAAKSGWEWPSVEVK